MNLRGQGIALTTPFTDQLTIDQQALRAQVEHLINAGVDYLVVLGTTAETATLTPEEKQQVATLVSKQTAGRVPLVLGMGGNNTAEVLETFKTFDLLDYQALLTVCPYYNKPSQEGIFQHFEALAMAAPLPLVLYNVPSRTGVDIAVETVFRLVEKCPNIIGIKEATSDFEKVQQLLRHSPSYFQVVSGDDSLALPTLLAGGVSVISVIGNALPQQFGELIYHGLNHRVSQAYSIQYALLDLINLLFKEGNPTGIKALLSFLNLGSARLRLPLVTASEKLQQQIAHEYTILNTLQMG